MRRRRATAKGKGSALLIQKDCVLSKAMAVARDGTCRMTALSVVGWWKSSLPSNLIQMRKTEKRLVGPAGVEEKKRKGLPVLAAE
jgi:hypothetical protein